MNSGGGGGVSVAYYWSSPGCCGASTCACLGVQYFSMKALLIGVTNNLVGGDGHSVELTEARNQSWKPQDLVGLLWVRWVSYGRDS